ncbi:MAG: hypothetical protein MPJ79_05245 [Alphaproteobacteria bacterium]|nr:hypothetical protein [Alphaproteobacteria bacterium]MDA7989360.1 hypothetical protein [Alphaproteobacteria bacterium]MDA8009379.1 hypothetical protein [Alphaproteobacteria bacterium]MDA8032296.1 hypothetical protein [Alphaproteobacteria bacterium]
MSAKSKILSVLAVLFAVFLFTENDAVQAIEGVNASRADCLAVQADVRRYAREHAITPRKAYKLLTKQGGISMGMRATFALHCIKEYNIYIEL